MKGSRDNVGWKEADEEIGRVEYRCNEDEYERPEAEAAGSRGTVMGSGTGSNELRAKGARR
jgi:hypothetical protein